MRLIFLKGSEDCACHAGCSKRPHSAVAIWRLTGPVACMTARVVAAGELRPRQDQGEVSIKEGLPCLYACEVNGDKMVMTWLLQHYRWIYAAAALTTGCQAVHAGALEILKQTGLPKACVCTQTKLLGKPSLQQAFVQGLRQEQLPLMCPLLHLISDSNE